MPWGAGNKTFIREIFDFCVDNTSKNFFNDYLEPFLYNALNTKRKNHYYKEFNCKIPFLNGGLFEPLEGYHWKDVNFEIPNELFSNKKEKDREADGILDIFDRFNFTMNEDEPLEKEVAVDSEINLLALTGILNSEPAHFWLLHNAKNRGIGLDIGVSVINQFPVSHEMLNNPDITNDVETIINLINKGKDYTENEKNINRNVFLMYGITKGKQKIINKYIHERCMN